MCVWGRFSVTKKNDSVNLFSFVICIQHDSECDTWGVPQLIEDCDISCVPEQDLNPHTIILSGSLRSTTLTPPAKHNLADLAMVSRPNIGNLDV